MENKNLRSRLICTGVVLIALIVLLMVISNAKASYVLGANEKDGAYVADFICDVSLEDTKSLSLDSIKKPGDSATIKLTVKNYNKSKICEVAQHVDLTYKFNGSMPLTAQIRKSDDNEPVFLNVKPGGETDISFSANFNAASKESITYLIDITWPESENDIKYANGNAIAELTIDVVATQID